MSSGLRAFVVVLACAAGMALVPPAAAGGRSQGRPAAGALAQARPGGFHGGNFPRFASRPFPGGPRRFGPHPFVRRGVPPGAYAAAFVYGPPLVYGSALPYDPLAYDAGAADAPAVSYAPPPIYAPPVSYAPPVAYAPNAGAVSLAPPPAPSPPPPPTPDVVEFPTGRYELRGDGITTPHTWVWVPAPPSQPPAGEPSRHQLYRWTDADGVAHWTDRLEIVPEQYRAEAQQPRLR